MKSMTITQRSGMALCWCLLLLLLAACSHSQHRADLYPPLWRIHSTAHSNSVWLFGTVHTMPRGKSSRLRKIQRVLSGVSPRLLRAPWVSNAIYNALVSSEKLVIELDLNRELRNDNARLLAYINDELQSMPVTAENLPTLHEYDLDQATQQALRAEAASRGIAIKDLRDLPLPAILLVLSIVPSAELTTLAQPGAEDWLVALMRLRDRRIVGLEQRDSRLQALTKVFMQSRRDQHEKIIRDYLATSLNTSDNIEADLERIYSNWLRGDTPQRQLSRMRFAARYAEIYQAFISHRNSLWLDEIARLADSGERVFIAVGEAHLYGPDNLRELLAQRGYRIERIH